MNKKIYLYDNENNNVFITESEAVLDPLEWELNNKINYLNPPNSTFEEPLEPKEGFNVCFNENENKWEYREIIEKNENKDNKNLIKLTFEQTKIIDEYNESMDYLSNTDWYVTRKLETGKEIPEEIKEQREEAREKISELIKENEFLKKLLNK